MPCSGKLDTRVEGSNESKARIKRILEDRGITFALLKRGQGVQFGTEGARDIFVHTSEEVTEVIIKPSGTQPKDDMFSFQISFLQEGAEPTNCKVSYTEDSMTYLCDGDETEILFDYTMEQLFSFGYKKKTSLEDAQLGSNGRIYLDLQESHRQYTSEDYYSLEEYETALRALLGDDLATKINFSLRRPRKVTSLPFSGDARVLGGNMIIDSSLSKEDFSDALANEVLHVVFHELRFLVLQGEKHPNLTLGSFTQKVSEKEGKGNNLFKDFETGVDGLTIVSNVEAEEFLSDVFTLYQSQEPNIIKKATFETCIWEDYGFSRGFFRELVIKKLQEKEPKRSREEIENFLDAQKPETNLEDWGLDESDIQSIKQEALEMGKRIAEVFGRAWGFIKED
jgi:hypothetical protein